MSPQVVRGPNDDEHSGQGFGGELTLGEPLLTEIDHVAIAVHDLDAAIDYYRDCSAPTSITARSCTSDGVEEALLKVAESYIQLLTPTTPTRRSRSASRRGARACTTSATASPTAPSRCKR